jgi:hypothetical protein
MDIKLENVQRIMYVLKPDVHAPVCDLGMVGSSHTVSIGLRLTVVSNFLVRPAVSRRDVWWDEGCPQHLRCAANNCTPTQSDFNAIEFRLGGSSGGSVTPRGS